MTFVKGSCKNIVSPLVKLLNFIYVTFQLLIYATVINSDFV